MYAPGTPPEIDAVLDWEMGTLGDPSADIGWMLCYWDTEPLIEDLMPTFLDRPGYPTKEELVERYEEKSGLEFTNRRFYVALGLYMLIAVCEMFYARYLNGNSNDDLYPKWGRSSPKSADGQRRSSRANGTSKRGGRNADSRSELRLTSVRYRTSNSTHGRTCGGCPFGSAVDRVISSKGSRVTKPR